MHIFHELSGLSLSSSAHVGSCVCCSYCFLHTGQVCSSLLLVFRQFGPVCRIVIGEGAVVGIVDREGPVNLQEIRRRIRRHRTILMSMTQQTFPSPFRAFVSAVDGALHCRGIKPARTSPAGSQIRCLAWISSAGKRGTHRMTSFCSSVSRVRATRTITLPTR